jgi:hypothetical protein
MSIELILLLIILVLILGPPRLSVPENIKSAVDIVIYIVLAVVVIKLLLTFIH